MVDSSGFALSPLSELIARLIANIERVIVGKRAAVELVLVGLLSEGHLLIEDVPGVGKTMLARSLARSIGCSFSRIQFTPDMLPSDLTGVSIFNQASRQFEFRAGPLMAQIVLADEINRATPKTQAALLEAMAERQVTVDGVTHPLPSPFLVLATQNPVEFEGTFPLPESQLDRFLLRVRMGYAGLDDEMRILEQQRTSHPLAGLSAVATAEELLAAQRELRAIHVSPALRRYIVSLIQAVRRRPEVAVGPSARASLALYRTGQVRAAMLGRDHVLPDDIKALFEPAVSHRVILSPEVRLRQQTAADLLDETLRTVPVPASGEAG